MKKNYKTSIQRISDNLTEYINFVLKRYLEEYGITLEFTEASNLIAQRAKQEKLFK